MKHVAEPRPRRSKLRDGGTESLDARVGGGTREELLGMDTAFCEAVRQAARGAAGRILHTGRPPKTLARNRAFTRPPLPAAEPPWPHVQMLTAGGASRCD